MNLSRNIPLILSNAARLEEEGLPAGAFSSRYSKYHRYGLLIACVVSTCISAIIGFVAKEWDIAMLIFALAVASLLLLVTVISYRCYVDNSVLREYYLILFFKIEREVLWADLKYYSKRTDVSRDTYSIRFYDAEKKKRISFDNGVVGFERIVKMAKRKKSEDWSRKSMVYIQYPPCSTCKKAKAWLDDHGLAYETRHIKEQNPTYEELKDWREKSGLPLKRFFNTSGLLYKSLNLKERLPEMSEEEQLRLLASDGMLVKRPILVADDRILVGFRESEWETIL